jgi:hypothetical protein
MVDLKKKSKEELIDIINSYEESPLIQLYESYQRQLLEYCSMSFQPINLNDDEAEKKLKLRKLASESQMQNLEFMESLRQRMNPRQLKEIEVLDVGFAEQMALLKEKADKGGELFNPYEK